jgi:hypothetical protein
LIFKRRDDKENFIKEHNYKNINKNSSLLLLNLTNKAIENYAEGFAKYLYKAELSNNEEITMSIALPYIDVYYPKISGEEIVLLEIDRGYFDIAFLTATYNSNDSTTEMSPPSVMTIPLHYSYLDYNNEPHSGEFQIIIKISVNRKFEEYNTYEFIIEMEYENIDE